jgi:hypothetical protein
MSFIVQIGTKPRFSTTQLSIPVMQRHCKSESGELL